MNDLSATELDHLLGSPRPPAVLDVRLEEDFAVTHLPGARNACVFKMSFLDDVAKLGLRADRPVVVYGAGANSHEARVAAGKLADAGFTQVSEFRDGLRGWTAAGHPVEGTGSPTTPEPLQGTFSIDLAESRVEWTGRNLLNRHSGSVAIKSGHVSFEKGWLVGGDFVVDLNALTCADIADTAMNRLLIDHLKSDDFLDVARFPEARFQIRKVEAVPGAGPGLPNLRISGDLTLRGQLKPLAFLAAAGRTSEGRPAAQAVFAFDRTTWGSIYGSGKFFQRLGMHLVNDLIEVQVRLLA